MGLGDGGLHGHSIDRREVLRGDLLVDEVQGGESAEEGGKVGKDRVVHKAGILF
jgi:hypothetical protein